MESEPDVDMPNTVLRGVGISVRLHRDSLLFFSHAHYRACAAAIEVNAELIRKGVRC